MPRSGYRNTGKLTFGAYQQAARSTAVYPVIGHGAVYPTLGAIGELGELANKLKKVFRDHNGEITNEMLEDLRDELGDVLWYVFAIAQELELDMEGVALDNIAKLHDRKSRGMLQGSGDKR